MKAVDTWWIENNSIEDLCSQHYRKSSGSGRQRTVRPRTVRVAVKHRRCWRYCVEPRQWPRLQTVLPLKEDSMNTYCDFCYYWAACCCFCFFFGQNTKTLHHWGQRFCLHVAVKSILSKNFHNIFKNFWHFHTKMKSG